MAYTNNYTKQKKNPANLMNKKSTKKIWKNPQKLKTAIIQNYI